MIKTALNLSISSWRRHLVTANRASSRAPGTYRVEVPRVYLVTSTGVCVSRPKS